MANKKRSRKPRGSTGTAPRAVASQRRAERAAREAAAKRQSSTASRTLGTVGERPPSPFGGLPVSEFAIFIGMVGVIVGFFAGGNGVAMAVGALVCVLGVTEVTAREHFSGFRSHTTLLAAIPAVIVEAAVVILFKPKDRALVALLVIPVFAICFFLLRRTVQPARHARVARPPAT